MRQTLKLLNPIKINGKEVKELTYDANEITGLLFTEADAKRKAAAGMKNISLTPAVEFDFALHMYLGFAAIIAVNGDIAFEDLERMHGRDTVEVMNIGRNFLMKSDVKNQKDSDEKSETTLGTTTVA